MAEFPVAVELETPLVLSGEARFVSFAFRVSSGWMGLRGMGEISWGGVGTACYILFSIAVHVVSGGVAVVSNSWGLRGVDPEKPWVAGRHLM